jgi:hypothetical protein
MLQICVVLHDGTDFPGSAEYNLEAKSIHNIWIIFYVRSVSWNYFLKVPSDIW